MVSINKSMLEKARRYCLRGEKCIEDVRSKLWQWKIPQELHEPILISLVEDRFIDEERFTSSYVHDKAYISKWGKIKIRFHLQNKGIPEHTIKKNIEEIDTLKYTGILKEVAALKWQQICKREEDYWIARQKLTRYLTQKGYEQEDIQQLQLSSE